MAKGYCFGKMVFKRLDPEARGKEFQKDPTSHATEGSL
jgi:hypothetical protein